MTTLNLPDEVRNSLPQLQSFFSGLGLPAEHIQDLDLFLCAFVHKSYASDFKISYDHNERLEFVGDAMLGSVIAKALFLDFPQMQESSMTLYKIALVREETLCKVAKKIWLHQQLFISKGEEKNQGREKASITSDALEAFIGYLALDLGYAVAEQFVLATVYPEIKELSKAPVKSYKTMTQELIQKTYKQLPTYLDSEAEHDEKGNVTLFRSEIWVNDACLATGTGTNKKKAQEAAAKAYYQGQKTNT